MIGKQEAMLSAYSSAGYSDKIERRNGACVTVSCPFHDERSPSCIVYADHYYCYGCGAQGSAEDWIRRLRYPSEPDRTGYAKAYDDLGEGKMVRPNASTPRQSVDRWRAEARREIAPERELSLGAVSVLNHAMEAYHDDLAVSVSVIARAYAERRGLIDGDGQPLFGVGYCSGSRLVSLLKSYKDTAMLDAAIELGLIGKRPDGSLYERMRGRLILPEGQPDGLGGHDCIWLTGRAIPGLLPEEIAHRAKYLHIRAPKPLFGSAAIGKGKSVLVVEGNICVLSLRKLGIAAVALCGKTIPERHRTWFYGRDVTICLDSPRTESESDVLYADTETLLHTLKPYAKSIDFLKLPPEYKDPAEYIDRWGTFPYA